MNQTTDRGGRLGAFARREWPHWLVLLGLFVASGWAWVRVTPPIPTHWNEIGRAHV